MNNHWTQLAGLYPDDQQCLASFVAWQGAEVLARVKPANLINVLDRALPCDRNIAALWKEHSLRIFTESELCKFELKQSGNRMLVLIYRPDALNAILQKVVVKRTLRRLGYRYNTIEEALERLKERMETEEFPHEVGFFLGYPIKDVYGFMGLCDLPLVGKGPWKMYGNLKASLAILNKHVTARESVRELLQTKADPMQLLQRKRPAVLQAA